MKRILCLSALSVVVTYFLLTVSCAQLDPPEFAAKTLSLPEQPFDYTNVDVPSSFFEQMFFTPIFEGDVVSPINGGGISPEGDFILSDSIKDSFVRTMGVVNTQGQTVTNHGATLGRVLFYDPQLSINSSVACASCHHQSMGFADNKAGSTGFGGKKTPRNSMSITNVGFNNNLFWDSRVQGVRNLIMQPIQNHIEMGMESPAVLQEKLASIDYYPALFEKAFGDSYISTERIADAMTQFMCSMVSCNSEFDEAQKTDFSTFSPLQLLGKDLFMGKAKCGQCHAGVNFSAPDNFFGSYGAPTIRGTANIGLDINYADNGMGEGQFKIPTLRNIALTAPYMHDGRFNTLEQVVEHYNKGIKNHNRLDEKLRGNNGMPQNLNLSSLEKQALVAFLHTLTDRHVAQDPKFSNPFK